jgi:exodeoxyribonuclease V alpha subunit
MDENIEMKLVSLSKSKFRSSFKLKDIDKKYVYDKGIDKIREHAYEFVNKRLGSKIILNDGKQTPMRGHPVFIAQHACACCCRTCLEKWYHIPQGEALSAEIQGRIVRLLIAWIEKEMTQAT